MAIWGVSIMRVVSLENLMSLMEPHEDIHVDVKDHPVKTVDFRFDGILRSVPWFFSSGDEKVIREEDFNRIKAWLKTDDQGSAQA